jgi:hypothetical protein
LNCVLCAVAIGVVASVVEQRIDGLIAVQVHNPEVLPFSDFADPWLARRNYVAVDGFERVTFALDEILANAVGGL